MSIHINHYYLTDNNKLKQKWSTLYANSSQNVFLDWSWMEAWLYSTPMSPIVIEVTHKNICIGLGLLFRKTNRICLGLIRVNQLWLHKYGNDELDQMWIEHNDFLLATGYEDTARKAMLEYLQCLDWHELYIGMSPVHTLKKFSLSLGHYRKVISSPDYSVLLSSYKDIEDYLASLSKNTRSQIRRTLKLLQKRGKVELIQALSEQEKRVFFNQIGQLHQKKWRNTDEGSGFDNPIFVEFHKKVIFSDVQNIYTRLYTLSVNGDPLAYIYLLQTDTTWSFYLSGIQTDDDNKIKIGLLAHCMMIEQAIKRNITKYTFLAGDARYKQSLSNIREEDQELACFTRGSIVLKFIQELRVIKQFIFLRQST